MVVVIFTWKLPLEVRLKQIPTSPVHRMRICHQSEWGPSLPFPWAALWDLKPERTTISLQCDTDMYNVALSAISSMKQIKHNLMWEGELCLPHLRGFLKLFIFTWMTSPSPSVKQRSDWSSASVPSIRYVLRLIFTFCPFCGRLSGPSPASRTFFFSWSLPRDKHSHSNFSQLKHWSLSSDCGATTNQKPCLRESQHLGLSHGSVWLSSEDIPLININF